MRKPKRLKMQVAIVLTALSTALPAAAAQFESEPAIARQLKLPVVEWKDPNRSEKAIILAIHGLTLYSETFDSVARHLADDGYPVYAVDLRGFGRWRTEPEKYDGTGLIDFETSKNDLVVTLKALRERYPGKKIFCLGESLGANLSIWLAANHPELVDGAIGSALCRKFRWHPRWRWFVDLPLGVMRPWKPIKLDTYTRPCLSMDEKVTDKYLDDPRIVHAISPSRLVKTVMTNKRTLKSIADVPSTVPLLIMSGKEDRLFKANTLAKAMKKSGSEHVELHVIPNRGHLLLECHDKVDPVVGETLDKWLAKWAEPGGTTVSENSVKPIDGHDGQDAVAN